MATKNRRGVPLSPPRVGSPAVGDGVFTRDWSQWVMELRAEVTRLQRLTCTVVVREVTAAYQALPGEMVLADPASGAFAVTLPPTTLAEHMRVTVKHDSDSGNSVTVDSDDGTIDDAATVTLAARQSVTVYLEPGTARWVRL